MKKLFDNKFFRIMYTLFRVCFVLMIVLYLSFIVVQRLSGNKSIFGYRLFNVATGSMAGVYDINDVIAVKDFDSKKLKVGDDIAYRGEKGGFEGLFVTHRIIKIEPTEDRGLLFTTQGVKSPTADPVIGESQILGKVVGVVPVISTLNHVIKSQLGFFLLVFCPLVLVIVLEVLQTITEIRLEKNEIQRIEKKSKSKKKESKKKNGSEEKEIKDSSEDEVKEDKIDSKVDNDEKSKEDAADSSDENKKVIEDEEDNDSLKNEKIEESKVDINNDSSEEKNDDGKGIQEIEVSDSDPEIVEVIEDDIEIL